MSIILPDDFTNRMKNMLGQEFDEFLASYDLPHFRGLRINRLKKELDFTDDGRVVLPFEDRLFETTPVPWCKTGFYYDDATSPGKHPYHAAGVYYIQEPSAMSVGQAVEYLIEEWYAKDHDRDIRILDLCAAPGGKTSHIASAMGTRGLLVANEIVPDRARILAQNVERMGICNCIVTNESPDRLANRFSGFFDIIVVDTPCSGEGMFRRDEIARTEWSLDNVKLCAERGQDILREANNMLTFGGHLVYSTCTFATEEDEGAIEAFMDENQMYHIVRVGQMESDGTVASSDPNLVAAGFPTSGKVDWTKNALGDIAFTWRLWPHKLHGEGHYLAVMAKGDADEAITTARRMQSGKKSGGEQAKLTEAIKLFRDFAKKTLVHSDSPLVNDLINGKEDRFMLFGENLYLMPDDVVNLKGLKVNRVGLQLGEIKKNRIEPCHALALALHKEDVAAYVDYRCDSNEVDKYLRGESLMYDVADLRSNTQESESGYSGWVVVCVDGYSLGWGKAAGGILKNHYPKGLRIQG